MLFLSEWHVDLRCMPGTANIDNASDKHALLTSMADHVLLEGILCHIENSSLRRHHQVTTHETIMTRSN